VLIIETGPRFVNRAGAGLTLPAFSVRLGGPSHPLGRTMLNKDSLEQLRALKQQLTDQQERQQEQLEAQKVRATGTVRGSQGRYGFVVQDDGRELYLPAEQMLRVFPDDRVQVEVITGDDGKTSAVVEQLLASPLQQFTGQYLVRDNAHFVEPDLPRLSRWLFVPPKLRGSARHGDLVRARINRHPLADGRPQARVDQVIGSPETPGIELHYALTRFGLAAAAPACVDEELLQPDWQQRLDLTALPFVTIDGADTQDMDDALHAERLDSGWRLWVAIADPSAWIAPGSKLEQAIAERASSVYLPGRAVAMLPEALANERCSLRPDAERLALVCALQVSADGGIESYEFSEAKIRSRAKLSYGAVAALLARDSDTEHAAELRELQALATALLAQRRRDHVLMPDRPDYRLQLDEHGKIKAILRQDKTAAHLLVEECMVAANRCAADFLQNDAAIFICHNGFRSERRETVTKLLTEQLPQQAAADIGSLSGYIEVIQALAEAGHPLPLRAILSRSLERSNLRVQAAPHFGMGLPCYTTITSPIRKYSDFLLHRLIKAKLRGEPQPTFEQKQLDRIQDSADRARQASHLAEQWLKCQYLQQLPAGVHRGEVCHVTSSGFVVRLDDNGIEGFVDTRHSGVKCSFDATTMRLSCGDTVYQLEQPVEVEVAAIDLKKRSINFRVPQQKPAAE
jgi:ribonuclease R